MYAEYLRRLLRPLGVYDLSPTSLSGAMTEAVGEAMDDAAAALDTVLRESVLATAVQDGLTKREALLPFGSFEGTAAERRAALMGFFRIGDDGSTAAALRECLAACGMECTVRETATPLTVEVSFPSVMGEPSDFSVRQTIIESILPCQLQVNYRFAWCSWEQTAQLGLTWGDLATTTWHEWATTEVTE